MDETFQKIIDFKDIINKDSYFESVTIPGTQAQTAANFSYVFTARSFGFEVIGVSEKHEVAGTDVGAVTLDVLKVPNGTAIGSGTSLLASQFNLKSSANTTVYVEGTGLVQAATTPDGRILKPYDSVGLKVTGTLTALQGVCVTVYYRWANRGSYR